MSSNKNSGWNLVAIIGLVIVTIVAGFAIASVVSTPDRPTNVDTSTDTSSDTGSDISPAPAPRVELPVMDLQGVWVADENGRQFTATVANGNISIELGNADMSMLYWNGTFDTSNTAGAIIISDKIDINKAVLSGADSKEFVFENDKLSFEFEAMGMKKTVVMGRA